MEQSMNSFNLKLGKTTFIVCVKQAESAEKPLETVLFDLCKREVLGGVSTAPKCNLENLAKTS